MQKISNNLLNARVQDTIPRGINEPMHEIMLLLYGVKRLESHAFAATVIDN